MWVADANCLLPAASHPGKWSFNRLLIVGAGLDAEKLVGWPDGRFGVEFLQFNGEHTNQQAGSVQGYNSLPGPDPLHRSELYQLWWRQEFFDRKFILRFGKVAPTDDFNNVLRPVPVQDQHLAIPAVSGLLYTPVFLNPTLLGAMPGYYNSAYGITATFTPVEICTFPMAFTMAILLITLRRDCTAPQTSTAIISTSEKRGVLGK